MIKRQQRIEKSSPSLSSNSELELLVKEFLKTQDAGSPFKAKAKLTEKVTLDAYGLQGVLERAHKVLAISELSEEVREYITELRGEVSKEKQATLQQLFILKKMHSRYFN